MDYTHFNELVGDPTLTVAGVDEAGRGPLAGPVFAAAVILPAGLVLDGLNDSKKISEKKREALYDIIKEEALAWSIASADHNEIDEFNILGATMLAMRRAVEGLSIAPDLLLIDGNRAKGFSQPVKTVIKGDALIPQIAAASILAKVERDRYCLEMAEKYPEYKFEVHKGYPTEFHRSKVREIGPCPEHRMTFLKKIL
ncbi:MAG: ribonuclease HII [Clostridia bacterium]|nr:ribonuclease HII [Clostridia bacterium]